LSRKVLYHFAIFVIVNKLVIIKNRRISLNVSAQRDSPAIMTTRRSGNCLL